MKQESASDPYTLSNGLGAALLPEINSHRGYVEKFYFHMTRAEIGEAQGTDSLAQLICDKTAPGG